MFDTKYGDSSDIVARHTEISGCGYPSTDSSLEQWSKYSGNIEKYSVIALILSIKVTVQLVEGVQMEHTYITLFKSISPQSAPCLPERMQVLGLIRRGKFQNTILAICSQTLLNCILPTYILHPSNDVPQILPQPQASLPLDGHCPSACQREFLSGQRGSSLVW